MAEELTCPSCGAIVTEILAEHHYTIELQSETGIWIKYVGEVTYSCGNCIEDFDLHDIANILEQVDEL